MFKNTRQKLGKWMGIASVIWLVLAVLLLLMSSFTKFLNPSFFRSLYLWITLIASLIAFLVFGWDKRAARKDKRRVSEKTLHTLAAIGGWAGAVLGQQMLRHKTQKWGFQVLLPVIAAFHVLVFIFLFVF